MWYRHGEKFHKFNRFGKISKSQCGMRLDVSINWLDRQYAKFDNKRIRPRIADRCKKCDAAEMRNEATRPEATLWVVFYRVVGSRCNGSYLVKAPSRVEAKEVLRRKLGCDFVVDRAVTLKEGAGQYSTTEEELIEGVRIPKKGQVSYIESGT
jgi:hypothetical protein